MAINLANANTNTELKLADAIKMYKAENYTECYTSLNEIIKKDKGNVLAYYYLAISASQVGKKEEALANYSKVLLLSPVNSNIYKYANKGKICIESPDKCEYAMYGSSLDAFIQSGRNSKISEEVKEEMNSLKLENLRREINRSQDLNPQMFKEYKDYSSMVNPTPSNDEIVAAIKTLQNAGIGNFYNFNNDSVGLSYLTEQNTPNNIFNMMGSSNINPQLIQTMLTNKMSLGF
jgi:tetratricopeptide (TPR) repeat protein